MFRPPGLLATQIAPTMTYFNSTPGSHGFYVPAYLGLLPPQAGDMLAARIGQLTAWGLSPHKIRGLAGRSPDASLTTCHALGPRQSLRCVSPFILDTFAWASGTLKPSPTALLLLTGLNCFGEVRLPCGLQCSLCTLQAFHFPRFEVLFHTCNTRYWWLVRPYQAGTCTLQETPSQPGALTLLCTFPPLDLRQYC